MKRRLLARRPSPAMVVALVALCSSLTGGAVAATLINGDDIAKKAIATKHLKRNAVVTKKVKNGTLLADDFKPGQLKEGVQGIQGLKGDKGEPGDDGADGTNGTDGTDATALWAVINSNGTTIRGSHITSSAFLTTGQYEVTFDQDVSECAFVVTPFETPNGQAIAGHPANANAVFVRTSSSAGSDQSMPFTLAVFC